MVRRSVMYQIFPDRFGFSDDATAERGIEYHLSLGQTPELHKSLAEPPRYQPRPLRPLTARMIFTAALSGALRKSSLI